MSAKPRGQISIEFCTDAIIQGIKYARKDYLNMAGEIVQQWPEWPEYWVTTHVVKQMRKKYVQGNLTLESGSDDVLQRKPGSPAKATKNKRYDIVLWRKNGDARAIIEIKHQQHSPEYVLQDLIRIMGALKAGPNLQFGALAYYFGYPSDWQSKNSRKTPREKVQTRRDSLLKRAQSKVKDTPFKVEQTTYMPRGDKDAWVAGCFMVTRKP